MGAGPSMNNQVSDIGQNMNKTSVKMSEDYIKQMKSIYNTMDGSMSEMMYQIRTGNPDIKNYVWPWNNFDFDYSKYVYNKYDPDNLKIINEQLGSLSGDGYLDVTQNNLNLIAKYYRDALREDAMPNINSTAGITGENNDVLDGATQVEQVKKKYNNISEPYPGFKNEYKYFFKSKFGGIKNPSGIHSSSYFIKTGQCPVPGITDMATCKAKGFTWNPMRSMADASMTSFFPGSDKSKDNSKCFKPRYAFIDNTPGSLYGGTDVGLIPTISKTMASLNPFELGLAAAYGRTSDGSYYLLPCNPTGKNLSTFDLTQIENFSNKKRISNKKNVYIIMLIFIIFSILYVISK